MSRRRPRWALVLVGALTVGSLATGCAGDSGATPELVTVAGEFGSAPELTYAQPLVVRESSVEVIREGTGPRVVEGEPVLLDFYAESGADGTVINETYSSEPRPYLLDPESLGAEIYTALRGKRVGSRILQVVPPDPASGVTTVAVFDILPTRASGESVPPREGLPTVELADDGEPTVAVPPDTAPPTGLIVQPLLRGSGPQVAAGQVITVQYVAVRWSDGGVFDSTWAPGKMPGSFPIGVGSVMEGWDEGLVEQPVGSQVLLVVPPELSWYGLENEMAEETMVFVVDILAASGAPASLQDGS